MNYYKLTMVIIPPAASVSSVFLSKSSALACPTTLTTRPVKQCQTGIRSSKLSTLACPTTLTTHPVKQCQTGIRSSKLSTLACPTTLTTCPVKQRQTGIRSSKSKHSGLSDDTNHMPCQTTSNTYQASRAPWPVQPH